MRNKSFLILTTLFVILTMSVGIVTPQIAGGGQFTLQQTVVATGGSSNAAGGQFSLAGTIGQAIAGDESVGESFGATSGFWNYALTAPAAATYEADVSPRSSGDGYIDADDVQEIRRFSVGLDHPYKSNEPQRGDCSPRSTFGDGFIDADDVQQARRYAVGLDAKHPASGPTNSNAPETEGATTFKDSSLQSAANQQLLTGRAVHVISQSTSAGQQVTVPVDIDSTGDETGYTFSLSYDATRLSNPVVVVGNAGGNVIANTTIAGKIGFSVTSFSNSNGTIAPLTNTELVKITFTVAANAPFGTTDIRFTDDPAKRKVSAIDPNIPLTQPAYTDGTITISGVTAATASISGRVMTADGRGIRNVRVTMTISRGEMQTVLSSDGGYFQFADVETGETYTFSAEAKHYQFNQPTLVRTIFDDTNNINFVAYEIKRIFQ